MRFWRRGLKIWTVEGGPRPQALGYQTELYVHSGLAAVLFNLFGSFSLPYLPESITYWKAIKIILNNVLNYILIPGLVCCLLYLWGAYKNKGGPAVVWKSFSLSVYFHENNYVISSNRALQCFDNTKVQMRAETTVKLFKVYGFADPQHHPEIKVSTFRSCQMLSSYKVQRSEF